MKGHLSKSKYLSGLHCTKRLWLEVHEPQLAARPSAFQKHLFKQGIEVGKFARTQFPDGVLINADHRNLQQAVEQTQVALNDGITTLFEATFAFEDIYVLVDVLTKNERSTWDLIEVKSSTRIKEEHLHDLAIQRFVLERSGLIMGRTQVMLVNNQCVFPNLEDFFNTEDVSERVSELMPHIDSNVQALRNIISNRNAPDVAISDHCKNPYPCPFKDHCWADVDGQPLVFDIPRLHYDKKEQLREQNIIFLEDLPDDFPLTEKQQAHVDMTLDGGTNINHERISQTLDELEYPLHFFDFETYGSAIPIFEGMRPYQQFPFQFSCHQLEADGTLTHREYLHTELSDPRPALVEALCNCLNQSGTIIAYGAAFEKNILMQLAELFPEHADMLHGFTERLWDQLNIFNKHYKDAAFGKSTSLKSVLPILVPDLDYGTLSVQKGDEAQSVWYQMIQLPPGPEKQAMIEGLSEYCKMDTLAMVRIHQVLQQQ